MKKIKQTLEKALLEAGAILKRAIERPIEVQYKSPVSLVTETDKKAERVIIDIIRRQFPNHSILAEESGEQHPSLSFPRKRESRVMDPRLKPSGMTKGAAVNCKWIIDPVDGTSNFAHRLPAACVSIAFEENGIVKVGGVWNPFYNEWFWAERGKGASLNGKKIRVSKIKTLKDSLLVTGFPYDRRKRASYYLKFMKAFLMKTQDLRRLGSAALDLCYVACGRFDGYWEFHLQPWDQAAAALIAKEAGARLSDFSGKPMNIYGKQTLATNELIHDEMLAIIKKHL